MAFFRRLFPNFSLKTLSIILLSTAAVSAVAYAAPTAPPGSTGYTLNDLYIELSVAPKSVLVAAHSTLVVRQHRRCEL